MGPSRSRLSKGGWTLCKIFGVELSAGNGRCTELTLPATPYAMLDALEKLRLEEGEEPQWEILRTHGCDRIYPYLNEEDSLTELNALCQQLALLDERQAAIVEGLLKAESDQGVHPIPMAQVINMAHSTDRCHLVEEATNDYTLGRFCAENSFVPEADDLSDKAFELLDFARIGREFRQNEGGVFTSGGYVQKHDELRQVYGTLNLTPKTPDYAVLVQTASGCEIKLPLPMGEAVADGPVQCVDCAAPSLIGLTSTIGTWDMLAHQLTYLTVDGELTKYKAVLTAIHCDDPNRALALVDELEQYTLSPQILEYEDVAKERLAAVLPTEEVDLISQRLNLYGFGQDLVEHRSGGLTGYGLVEHKGAEQEQTGAPTEAQRSGFGGERSRSEMSELSPQAEANDMELGATNEMEMM